MKNILLSIMILATTAFAGERVTPYLPKDGTMTSKILIVGFPEKIQLILKKYGESTKKNAKWFKDYGKLHKGKFPLPYHKNLGLTKDEYKEFKGLSKSMTLIEDKNITLAISTDANKTIFSVKDNPKHFLNGLKIYKDDTVDTKFGKLTDLKVVNKKRASTGKWTGVEWQKEISHAGRVQIVKFALGKRDRGDYIIYYDIETFSPKSKKIYGYILHKKEIKPDIQKKLIHIR